MTTREFRARHIIKYAVEYRISIAEGARHMKLPMPALTKEECVAIAVDVPYSWMYLRDAFLKAQ